FRLLPASAYLDESRGHPGGQHPGSHPSGAGLPVTALPAAVTAAAHFPGVDLRDGHVPAANLHAAVPSSAGGAPPGPASGWSDSADLADTGPTRAEPTRTAPPGAEHASSAESDHSSASWWEKSHPQPGPTRTP
ncbi:MAG: hypothetical protein ACRDPF_15380, partial [Streptosporangiaceae bacterium]